jgi:hypothetical protein
VEIRSAKMTCVTVVIRERALTGVATHRKRVTAPFTGRVPRITGDGKPGRKVRLLFPIVLEAFLVPEGRGRREAA